METAAAAAAEAPDWSRLPEDLLLSVMATMEITDLVRSGAVCTHWHSAYSTTHRLRLHSLQQSPWLFYSSEADDPDTATLYNPSTNTFLCARLPDPPLGSRRLVGSAHGWLVTVDEVANLHLLNPLTDSQIALPPVTALHHVEDSTDKEGNPVYIVHNLDMPPYQPCLFSKQEAADGMYRRVAFSCSPSSATDTSCVVVILHYPYGQMSFARLGDDRWTWIPPRESPEEDDCYCDVVYNKDDGLFYVLRLQGSIRTLDLNGPTPVVKKIFHDLMVSDFRTTNYIVFAPWGDLLRVGRVCNFYDCKTTAKLPAFVQEDQNMAHVRLKTDEIQLYRIDFDGQKLEKITSLGDNALFLCYGCTICLPIKDFPMTRSDCAYLTNDFCDGLYN